LQYALLIYDDGAAWAELSEEEQNRILGEYWALDEALKQAGAHAGGEALHPVATARSVRVRNGETLVTDGPFAETKEALGGFYLIDVDSEAEALEWAARIPSAPLGTIEVRPVMVWNEDGTPVPLPDETMASRGGAA
jgi:hypothetical protein